MRKIFFTLALLLSAASSFSQTRYYVNDNSTAGDVFTTAVGNNANPGTAAAPLASIITAYFMTLPGDTIFVDAGTFTADGTIGKSITILGTNYLISPNNTSDPLLPNPGRNAESIITNSTWTIGANNINLEGLIFDPNSRRAIGFNGGNFNNLRISKNRFKINASNTQISFAGVGTPSIITSAIVNSGFVIIDNRFEKYDLSNGLTININRVKNLSITNNSFVAPGATTRNQTVLSVGTGGVTDAIVFSNNTVDMADVVVGNGISANMVISGNKIYNCDYAMRVNNPMPESSIIDFSNNLLDGGSGISPLISYKRFNGFSVGSASSFKAENNTITGNAIPAVSGFMGSFYVSFVNSVLNPSLTIRRNKISYTGDYGTIYGQDIQSIVLAGNINNANIDNNEITLAGTNIQPRNPINNLPLCPAISLYPENGSGGVVQPGAIINILNNKVNGFKQSFVIFDPFDLSNGGVDAFTGYGNLNPLAILNVNNNSFTGDSISVNNGDNFDNDLNVRCNWFGSKADQDIFTKISYQSITAIPWLTNGTDNDPATGFQPVPGSCDGYPPVIVLNSYTNATCPGANNGTININVSLGMAPFIFTWTKAGDPGFISHDEDPVNLSPGTYHLSVVDGNGSTIYVDADINYSNSIDVNIVTIPDTEAPVITCPAAITVSCDGSTLPAATGFATAADNCTAVANISITFTDISTKDANPANNAYYNYTITRTWKAVDANENFITCNQIITAHDLIAPVISCPPNPTLNCQDNNSSASTGEATATDNCSPVTITQSQTSTQTATGAGHYNYVITRTWKASDVTGNFSTCMQAIMVRDITSPEITCVTNQSRLTNSGMCTYQVQGAEFNATATDNCAVPALSYVLTGATTGSGTNSLGSVTLNRGTTTISWKATDPSGNFKSCSFNIIVNDDLNPTGYIIYATKEAEFGEKNYINGDVGVTASNGKAEFKKYDVLDPYTVTAKNISIQLPTSVNNRVYNPATGGPNPTFLVHVANPLSGNYNATTNGMVPAGNFKNLTIKKGVIATVNGSDYGNISIEEGAVVTFTSSNINLEELTIGKGKNNGTTTVIFTNPGSVKVSKKVMVEEDCNVNVGGPKITFYLGDNNPDKEKFTVKGDNTLITLNIMIPKGKLMVDGHDRNIIMTGWYIVEELEGGGKNQNITWNKYDCSPPAPLQSLIKPTEPFKETPAILEEVKDQFKVNAYPNPTAGEFSLQVFSNSNDPFMIRIMDMKGVVKSVNTIVSKTSVIKVGAGLIGGTYIAELTQGNKRTWVKLVKLN